MKVGRARTSYSLRCPPSVALLTVVAAVWTRDIIPVRAYYEKNDNADDETDDDGEIVNPFSEGLEWLQQYSLILPYLAATFIAVFGLYLILHSRYATYNLMKTYRDKGAKMQGEVLSCEARSGGATYSMEVLYHAREHKYVDNRSMRFRYPEAVEERRFFQRFDSEQPANRGDPVDMYLLGGKPRSGVTAELVHRNIAQHEASHHRVILIIGAIIVAVTVVLTIVNGVLKMEDQGKGWIFFLVSLVLIWLISYTINEEQFEQHKLRTYVGAQPMISTVEQYLAQRAKEEEALKQPFNPFEVPMNEFAGHARVTLRQVPLTEAEKAAAGGVVV